MCHIITGAKVHMIWQKRICHMLREIYLIFCDCMGPIRILTMPGGAIKLSA